MHTETPTIKLTADAEPAERALKGGKLARKKHFQRGSLFNAERGTKCGLHHREPVIGANGETEFVRRSEILGTVTDLPTRRDAEMVLSDRLRRVNSADYHPRSCCLVPFLCPGVGSASSPNSQVCNARALQIRCELSPTACVRECPVAHDLAGINSDASRGQTERGACMAHSQTSPNHARNDLGNSGFWGYIDDNPVRKTRLPRRGLQPERTVLTPERAKFPVGKAARPVLIARLAVGLDRPTDRRITGLALARCRFAGWTPSGSARFTKGISTNPRPVLACVLCL